MPNVVRNKSLLPELEKRIAKRRGRIVMTKRRTGKKSSSIRNRWRMVMKSCNKVMSRANAGTKD
jgi:hypothetical protein